MRRGGINTRGALLQTHDGARGRGAQMKNRTAMNQPAREKTNGGKQQAAFTTASWTRHTVENLGAVLAVSDHC